MSDALVTKAVDMAAHGTIDARWEADIPGLSELDATRYQRDMLRGRCSQLERDNARLTMLLGYAKEAARSEYLLRISPSGEG